MKNATIPAIPFLTECLADKAALPDRVLPANDCGDHLHPGDAGYKAMSEAIDWQLFQ